jgi:hypothetical protein
LIDNSLNFSQQYSNIKRKTNVEFGSCLLL